MNSESARSTFRVATLNVHGWMDADYETNVDRVVKLVKVSLTVRFWQLYRKYAI